MIITVRPSEAPFQNNILELRQILTYTNVPVTSAFLNISCYNISGSTSTNIHIITWFSCWVRICLVGYHSTTFSCNYLWQSVARQSLCWRGRLWQFKQNTVCHISAKVTKEMWQKVKLSSFCVLQHDRRAILALRALVLHLTSSNHSHTTVSHIAACLTDTIVVAHIFLAPYPTHHMFSCWQTLRHLWVTICWLHFAYITARERTSFSYIFLNAIAQTSRDSLLAICPHMKHTSKVFFFKKKIQFP